MIDSRQSDEKLATQAPKSDKCHVLLRCMQKQKRPPLTLMSGHLAVMKPAAVTGNMKMSPMAKYCSSQTLQLSTWVGFASLYCHL